MSYINQKFGTREIIRDYCVDEDWLKINRTPPKRKDKYVLGKCLNCGSILPSMLKNIIHQPPKRCVYCSNIGNHFNMQTHTNSWAVYDEYAVCNIFSSNKVTNFYIDNTDYETVSQYVWRISKKRQKIYIISGSVKKGTSIYLHELIYGKPHDGYEIDHIDGNSLNNRRNNLRAVTRQENIDNQKATRIDNTIGIRGVVHVKSTNRYKVDFHYHGKRYYTTDWKTIEEAVWCRYCFEDYFGLPAIKSNPLAKQYYTLSEERKNEIKEYVLDKILRNER